MPRFDATMGPTASAERLARTRRDYVLIDLAFFLPVTILGVNREHHGDLKRSSNEIAAALSGSQRDNAIAGVRIASNHPDRGWRTPWRECLTSSRGRSGLAAVEVSGDPSVGAAAELPADAGVRAEAKLATLDSHDTPVGIPIAIPVAIPVAGKRGIGRHIEVKRSPPSDGNNVKHVGRS